MPAIQRILAFVDEVDLACNAPETAAIISQRQQAELHLLYVIDPDRNAVVGDTQSLDDRIEAGKAIIRDLSNRFAGQYSIRCRGHCEVGAAPALLTAAARRLGVDLLVAGIYGTPDGPSFFLDTQVYQTIRTAACPVLTVPVHQPWAAFHRVLFPVRPVPGALEKYGFARPLLQQNRATLTLLALHAPDEIISIGLLNEEIETLEQQLTRDAIPYHTLFCPTDLIPEVILQTADELAVDLLIITASLYIAHDELLVGSFTQQIVYNARMPVLFVRPEPLPVSSIGA